MIVLTITVNWFFSRKGLWSVECFGLCFHRWEVQRWSAKGTQDAKLKDLTEIPRPGFLLKMHNGWTQYSNICDVRQNKNSSGQSSLPFAFSSSSPTPILECKVCPRSLLQLQWGWGTALRSHCEANYVVDSDVKALKFTHLPGHCQEAKLLQSELTLPSQNHRILWEIELYMVGVFSLIMPMKTAKRVLMVALGSWLVFKQKSEESQSQKFFWLVLSQLSIFLSCLLSEAQVAGITLYLESLRTKNYKLLLCTAPFDYQPAT